MPDNNLQKGSVHARVTFRGDTVELLSGNPFPDNNVSSVEKLSTGLYKINYSSNLSGANHVVAVNCQSASAPSASGCVELVSTAADSATISAKLAGEGYGSVTYFDPPVVDFIASSDSSGPVNLSVNTIKAWASIQNGVLKDGANIENVEVVSPGVITVNFKRAFSDYTVIASCSNSANNQGTASVTYVSRGAKSIQLFVNGFGESINDKALLAFTPAYLNLMVFGNFGDFVVTLDTVAVSGDCAFRPPNSCRAITGPVTVNTVGGTAPFTYQWKYIDGAVGFQIANPTSKTTVFSKTGTADSESARFQVEVTDALGKKATSDLVRAEIVRTRLSEPEDIPPALPITLDTPIFATNFDGVTFDDTLGFSGVSRSSVLVGTDNTTKMTFSTTAPKLWGGARQSSIGGQDRYNKEHELQSLPVSTKTLFNASQLVPGRQYSIQTLGDTNWTAIGAPANPQIGTTFVATGAGSGTGTAAYAAFYLWNREIRPSGAPGGKPCLRIYPTHDTTWPAQCSFLWYSGGKLANQSMYYIRLKMRLDPTWPQIVQANPSDDGSLIICEFKSNNLDTQQSNADMISAVLSLSYTPNFGPWSLNMGCAYGNRPTKYWLPAGGQNTAPFNSDPTQHWFYGDNNGSTFFSYGGMTRSTAPTGSQSNVASPTNTVDFGNWWTIEIAVRAKDPNTLVAGRDNVLDLGNKTDGYIWVASATSGSQSQFAPNGSGQQRFFIPGINIASPANLGIERLFPFTYYTNFKAANKWIEWASVEVWDRFPPDASPRTGAAANIS